MLAAPAAWMAWPTIRCCSLTFADRPPRVWSSTIRKMPSRTTRSSNSHASTMIPTKCTRSTLIDNDATAEDLWAANGAYLIFQTLNGAGVGIWDGDWTDFYEDTDKAEKFLKGKLGKFADDSGAGSLNEAFMNAADESCGGDDDDDESDDDDDEDDED